MNRFPPNQAGFLRNKSCIQQIHIIRRLIEGAKAHNLPIILTFIDFKKAFDSINREVMFGILRYYGIPQITVDAIKVMYNNSNSRVLVDGCISNPFEISTGVLQGDVLAPTLFIIVMDYVMSNSAKDFGFVSHPRLSSRSEAKVINDLDFADDIALLETTVHKAQEQLEVTSLNAQKVGLNINTDKTKYLTINIDKGNQLSLEGCEIEEVKDFKYLGSMVVDSSNDLKIRKAQAWGAFWKLKDIWKSKSISIKTKIRIFQASCVSILLYGSETWIITEDMKQSINSFATNCYRIMKGVKYTDKISNADIYKMVGQEPLTKCVTKRQLTWVGHMLRRDSSDLINIYALYSPNSQLGFVKQGRPKMNFVNYISNTISLLKDIKLNELEIRRMASDRSSWKKLVIDCTNAIK